MTQEHYPCFGNKTGKRRPGDDNFKNMAELSAATLAARTVLRRKGSTPDELRAAGKAAMKAVKSLRSWLWSANQESQYHRMEAAKLRGQLKRIPKPIPATATAGSPLGREWWKPQPKEPTK